MKKFISCRMLHLGLPSRSCRVALLLVACALAALSVGCMGEKSPPSPAQNAPQAPAPAQAQAAPADGSKPRDLFEAFSEGPAEFNALFANPARPTLPDLSKATNQGQQPAQDILPTVAGAETTLTGYQLGNIGIIVCSLPNGKVYAFTLRKIDTGEERSYFDREGDGVFEQQGEYGDVNEKAYGY